MSQKRVFAVQPFEMGGDGTEHRSLVIVIPSRVVKTLSLSKSSILALKLDPESRTFTLQALNVSEEVSEIASS